MWLSMAVEKRLLSAFSPVRRLAGILKRQTVAFRVDLQSLSEQQVVSDQFAPHGLRHVAERAKYKPLVSEYDCYVLFVDELLNVAEQHWQFPSRAKAVGRRALKWGEVRADPTIKQVKLIRERSTI